MSFGSLSSASSSIPKNLGVGSTQGAAKANAANIKLSVKDQDTVDRNLYVVKKIWINEDPKPTKEQLQALSKFTEELITNPSFKEMSDAIIGLQKQAEPGKSLSYEDRGVNVFGEFIKNMREYHVELSQIAQKFKGGQTPLSYSECRIIDNTKWTCQFANEMLQLGVVDNPHFNNAVAVVDFANKNAFKDFQDGDVLFYDLVGRMAYLGKSVGILDNIVLTAMGTNYAHVGVFYRDSEGKPCVAEIQGGYARNYLNFGQMSYIKGKRIDPAQFIAKTLTPEQRTATQKSVGALFARIVKGTGENQEKEWKLGITMAQQIYCVFGHATSEPTTKMGQTKLKEGENVLCSEFAALGLIQSFDEYNEVMKIVRAEREKLLENPFDDEYNAFMQSQVADEFPMLTSPFSEYENMKHFHPQRLLSHVGPHKDGVRVDSGWVDVPDNVDVSRMLPQLPGFPDLSYAKRDLDPAGHYVKKASTSKPKPVETGSAQPAAVAQEAQKSSVVSATGLDDVQIIIGDDDAKKKAESDKPPI